MPASSPGWRPSSIPSSARWRRTSSPATATRPSSSSTFPCSTRPAASRAFLARHAGAPLVVLDIPLLFETGAEARCDAVLVVTAPPEVQRARVLARPGMDEAAFAAIRAKQMPDAEKRKRADFVVDSSHGLEPVRAQIAHILAEVVKMPQRRA